MVHGVVESSTRLPLGPGMVPGRTVQPVHSVPLSGVPVDFEGDVTIGWAPGAVGFLVLLGVFPVAVLSAFFLIGRWAPVPVALIWMVIAVVYGHRSAGRL